MIYRLSTTYTSEQQRINLLRYFDPHCSTYIRTFGRSSAFLRSSYLLSNRIRLRVGAVDVEAGVSVLVVTASDEGTADSESPLEADVGGVEELERIEALDIG